MAREKYQAISLQLSSSCELILSTATSMLIVAMSSSLEWRRDSLFEHVEHH